MTEQTNAATKDEANEEIPQQVLSRCVNPDGISWPAIWYFSSSAGSFPVCSYCYSQYIEPTPHAGLFEAVWLDGSVPLTCQWNTLRVMSHLAAGDWDAIKAFMVERAKIPACKGAAGHTGLDGSLWYGMVGAWEIQNFALCEACYHDLVAWNQLKSYFTTTPTTKSDEETWTCATALQLIKEGLYQAITSRNRWEDLHPLFKRRMEYPSCKQMRNLTAGSTNWYVSKAVPDLCVCAACYLDHFVLDHANSWELVYPSEEQEQQIFECAMHTVILALWISYKRISIAEKTDEYDEFEGLARMILESPPCSTDDMRDATWYAPEACTGDAFAICRRCLIGYMGCPGFAAEFKEVDFRRDGKWVCDLNPATPRYLKYMAKYSDAVVQGNFSIFTDYVSEYAPVPDCPRNEAYVNRKWYIKNGFTACELCYKEVIDGTSLASQLECAVIPNESRCQIYSRRMRNLWQQACESNDLASFLTLANERMNAFQLMKIEEQRQIAEMIIRSRQRNTLMLASTIGQGTEGLAMAIGADNGTRYGNSSIGYNWHTPSGAESHQLFQQAMGMDVVQASASSAAMIPLIRRWAMLE